MLKPQIILAIESSCDETAAAVIRNGQILSSVIASQAKLHSRYGGIVPEVAAREHVTAIMPTIDLALKQAKIKLIDLNYIAVTQGPGLPTSLMVGVDTAKALSMVLDIPVIPINHLEAHVYANFVGEFKISNLKFKIFPALILIVSGGHTLLVLMRGHNRYQILGETLDDAAGEAFDKTAKMLGLGYPGGPQLARLAKRGNPQAFAFPRPMLNVPGFNFSFSGLKTAVLYEITKHVPRNTHHKADLAASVQQAIVDVLIAKVDRAIEKFHPKIIMLGGGVAANRLLRQRFSALAQAKKIRVSIPEFEFCTDNAAMIGLAAYYRIKTRSLQPAKNFTFNPNLELK